MKLYGFGSAIERFTGKTELGLHIKGCIDDNYKKVKRGH